jgi:transcriptional regulator with XRE-family HTH domain
MHNSNRNPVRLAREQAGLSQVQLAIRSRRSLSTIRNAEQGLATTQTLAAIATVLGVDVHTLRPSPSSSPS